MFTFILFLGAQNQCSLIAIHTSFLSKAPSWELQPPSSFSALSLSVLYPRPYPFLWLLHIFWDSVFKPLNTASSNKKKKKGARSHTLNGPGFSEEITSLCSEGLTLYSFPECRFAERGKQFAYSISVVLARKYPSVQQGPQVLFSPAELWATIIINQPNPHW